jgi:hypothetical protein
VQPWPSTQPPGQGVSLVKPPMPSQTWARSPSQTTVSAGQSPVVVPLLSPLVWVATPIVVPVAAAVAPLVVSFMVAVASVVVGTVVVGVSVLGPPEPAPSVSVPELEAACSLPQAARPSASASVRPRPMFRSIQVESIAGDARIRAPPCQALDVADLGVSISWRSSRPIANSAAIG